VLAQNKNSNKQKRFMHTSNFDDKAKHQQQQHQSTDDDHDLQYTNASNLEAEQSNTNNNTNTTSDDKIIDHVQRLASSASASTSGNDSTAALPALKRPPLSASITNFFTTFLSRLRELCTLEYAAKFFLLICFFFCFSVDISMYTSFALSTAAMLGDKLYLGTNFNKETLGIMNAVATALGFLGKLIMPFFVDYFGGVAMSLAVTFFMSIGIFTLGYSSYVLAVMAIPAIAGGTIVHVFLTIIYSVDRFVDAAAWSSLTLIIRTWFPAFTWGTM